jgi:hypothetical protein
MVVLEGGGMMTPDGVLDGTTPAGLLTGTTPAGLLAGTTGALGDGVTVMTLVIWVGMQVEIVMVERTGPAGLLAGEEGGDEIGPAGWLAGTGTLDTTGPLGVSLGTGKLWTVVIGAVVYGQLVTLAAHLEMVMTSVL